MGKKWTLQILIPQFPVLILKLSPIYKVSLNTVFSIPQISVIRGPPVLSFARFPCEASKASLIQNLCELFCTLLVKCTSIFLFFADSKKVSEFELELKKNDEVRKSLERHVTINEDPTIVKETKERDEWDNNCSFFLSALGFAGMFPSIA